MNKNSIFDDLLLAAFLVTVVVDVCAFFMAYAAFLLEMDWVRWIYIVIMSLMAGALIGIICDKRGL